MGSSVLVAFGAAIEAAAVAGLDLAGAATFEVVAGADDFVEVAGATRGAAFVVAGRAVAIGVLARGAGAGAAARGAGDAGRGAAAGGAGRGAAAGAEVFGGGVVESAAFAECRPRQVTRVTTVTTWIVFIEDSPLLDVDQLQSKNLELTLASSLSLAGTACDVIEVHSNNKCSVLDGFP